MWTNKTIDKIGGEQNYSYKGTRYGQKNEVVNEHHIITVIG